MLIEIKKDIYVNTDKIISIEKNRDLDGAAYVSVKLEGETRTLPFDTEQGADDFLASYLTLINRSNV